MPALPNQKGGASPLPMPRQIPTPSTEGIGKPPPPQDTSRNVACVRRTREQKFIGSNAKIVEGQSKTVPHAQALFDFRAVVVAS
jgi:hypothetical protein